MSNLSPTLDFLLSPEAIRDRAKKIHKLSLEGKTNFIVHEDKLNSVVEYVYATILKNYPDLNIPFHSRWGHFRANKVNRELWVNEKIQNKDKLEVARIKLDLVIVSVLLDAGAGDTWKYFEKETESSISRSEGLGVASLHMFLNGKFSSAGELKVDALQLMSLTAKDIEEAFQVSENNPLLGVEGRTNLLKSLGMALKNNPHVFKDGRPGNILDYMLEKYGKNFKACDLLKVVLINLGDIWPGREKLEGVNLGDVWKYEKLGQGVEGLVPFHKLSQWLTYSLIEPFQEAGFEVQEINRMTGLPEYRNGGLLIDRGLIELRDPKMKEKLHGASSELVIEWRALTVYFLDLIGKALVEKLNTTEEAFPLCKVLEGGTWWAGRFAAKELRDSGAPPLNIISDGTVF